VVAVVTAEEFQARITKVEGDKVTVQKMKGKELEGLRYTPLFDYFVKTAGPGAFRVVVDNYVTDADGTGVVHQAPAFGEDDNRVCMEHGVTKKGEGVICPVDMDGNFTAEVTDFAGKHVKDPATDPLIVALLKKKGRLVDESKIKHQYPHCWRSDTPLIYRAVPSWFVDVPKIKADLLKNNEQTYWVPDFVKSKRFHNWLEDAREWSVSRSRYWGTPLPIWRSDDKKEMVVIGSIEELEKLSGVKGINDLHRDSIDHIVIPSERGPEHNLKRVPEVFDCWFESGSMPYAQVHYPFENKEFFETGFPADFIAEGLDQTRGWFYTLMVISTALFNKPAFKNLVVNGLVLAEDGSKMSKRKKNYPDPLHIVNNYGADALRIYLINSPVVRAEPLRFKESGVFEVVKTVLLPWRNAYRFFVEQARRLKKVDKTSFEVDPEIHAHTTNVMDKWILSSLQSLIAFVHEEMEAYRLYTVVPRLVEFTVQMSNWYVRMNKNRLKGSNGKQECQHALATLYEVLMNLARLMAPFSPFMSEVTYLNLRKALPAKDRADSVHYLMVPQANQKAIDLSVELRVAKMQTVIELGRVTRESSGISLKVPVPEVFVVCRDPAYLADVQFLSEYIKVELNAKNVVFSNDVKKFGVYHAEPNSKQLGPRLKQKRGAVEAKIRALTHDEVANLEQEKKVVIEGETITYDDVTITWDFTGDSTKYKAELNRPAGVMVVSSAALDDECKQEGFAREVMNRIQKARKEAKLKIEDVIKVFYEPVGDTPQLQLAVTKWADFIQKGIKSTVAHKSTMPDVPTIPVGGKPFVEAEVHGEKFNIYLTH